MATGEQFRAAAGRLRSAAESAHDAQFHVRTASYAVGVVGCDLEALADRSMAAAEVNAADLEAACQRAEDECLVRAALCDAFAVQYAQWEANRAEWQDLAHAASVSGGELPDPGPPPVAPVPPASWVDHQ